MSLDYKKAAAFASNCSKHARTHSLDMLDSRRRGKKTERKKERALERAADRAVGREAEGRKHALRLGRFPEGSSSIHLSDSVVYASVTDTNPFSAIHRLHNPTRLCDGYFLHDQICI